MKKFNLVKITKVLANNIKLFRESKSISVAELAGRVGVSRQTINNIETEKSWITVSLIEKIAKEFGVEQHVLFQSDLTLKKEVVSSSLT